MKLNKKGFVLAETLVVAVFMATIFTIIYVNFYPLIGEYEKREYYDDLDSKYDIYWFKRLVQNKYALPTSTWEAYTGKEYVASCDSIPPDGYCDVENPQIKNQGYVVLINGGSNDCNMFSQTGIDGINYKQLCLNLKQKTGITKLYLTTYYLNNPAPSASTGGQQKVYKYNSPSEVKYFKNVINNTNDENFKDYVFYLPDYRYASQNGARFRLVAQFERHTTTPPYGDDDIKYYSYATIEVNREKGV